MKKKIPKSVVINFTMVNRRPHTGMNESKEEIIILDFSDRRDIKKAAIKKGNGNTSNACLSTYKWYSPR